MQMEMLLEGGGPLTTRRRARRRPPARRNGAGQKLVLALADVAASGAIQPEPRLEPLPRAANAASARAEKGRRGYLAGLAAEDGVARHYALSGLRVEARRWRGPGGEIDLILREGARLVFVEVKASRSFDAAITRLTRRQIDRIRRSAEAYCGTAPDGLLTEMRFDLALVDGRGAVRVIEGAFDGG